MAKKNKPALSGYDGPRKTALESIRSHCRQCMGDNLALIRECQTKGCALHSYRTGEIETGASRRLLKVIRSFCDTCAAEGDVSGCTAGRVFLALPPCPLWPYRTGRSPYTSEKVREQRRARAVQSRFWETGQANSAKGSDDTSPASPSV